MNAIPDKFAVGAAYVLGALSPAERRQFEEHMASCLTASLPSRNLLPTRVCWLRSRQRIRRCCL